MRRTLGSGAVVALAAGCLLATLAPARRACAQTSGLLAGTSAASGVVSPGAVTPGQDLLVSYDGQQEGLVFNLLVGADRFYNAGVFGQGTVSANVEAGLVWNGHEITSTVQDYYIAPGAAGDVDQHATVVGSIIAGYNPNADPNNYPWYQLGMAPFTRLASGAIATNWYTAPDPATGQTTVYFNTTAKTFYSAYNYYFTTTWDRTLNFSGFSINITAPTDVINSSWGYSDPQATDPYTQALDGFARANPLTTFVAAAGNSTSAGNPSNNVGGPASGYNGISVGAVGNGSLLDFSTVADFSSRGPQDYYDPVHGVVHGVRAPVDIVAPGTTITGAYYGGQTGGNGAQLSTTVPDATNGANNYYTVGAAGTSFAAPFVTGAVSLLKSTSYLAFLGDTARDTRVIKAVLLNSATKLPGWDNGQAVNGAGVTVTTQALDWSQGAGMLNLNAAFDQYLGGTVDVPGTGGGLITEVGWDYGSVLLGTHNDYPMSVVLTAGTRLDATLTWFRDLGVPVFTDNADPDLQTLTTDDQGFANLGLEIWNADFTRLYAESISLYNNVQELDYIIPQDGTYAIRVDYFGQMFGTPVAEGYGLAWAAPEPATLWLLWLGLSLILCRPQRDSAGRSGRAA